MSPRLDLGIGLSGGQWLTEVQCGHIFCKDCIETFVAQLVAQESDYWTCPECNRVFEGMEKVIGPQVEPESSSSSSRRSKSKSKGRANGKGKGKEREEPEDQGEGVDKLSKGRDLMGFEPITNDSTWVTKSDKDDGFPLTPSTKTTALKALLLKGFEEAPLDKVCFPSLLFLPIFNFTNFLAMLK